MICTCNINNIKDMSPAFVNRFDVIVLENQLEKLNEVQLCELISNLSISFERIPQKNNKFNLLQKQGLKDVEFIDDENENIEENENNEKNKNKKIEKKEENIEEIIKKEKEFLNNEKVFIKKISDKIKILPLNKENEDKRKEYSHLRTITSLNLFCYGIMKLRKIFKQTKYEEFNIKDDVI